MSGTEAERPRSPRRAPVSRWDRAWPRFLAALQAVLGTWGFVSQIQADADRPYLLLASVALVSGAPLTARILAAFLERRPPR